MISEFPHLRRFELEKEIQNLRDEVARLKLAAEDRFKETLNLRAEFGNQCREVVELRIKAQELAAIQQGIVTEYAQDQPSGDVVADFATFMEHHRLKEELAEQWRGIALRYARGNPTSEDVFTVGLALLADQS